MAIKDQDTCKHTVKKCLNSRPGDGYTRRRYKCHLCGKRFSTIEVEIDLHRGKNAMEALREQYGEQPDYAELEKAIEQLIKLRDGGKIKKPKM